MRTMLFEAAIDPHHQVVVGLGHEFGEKGQCQTSVTQRAAAKACPLGADPSSPTRPFGGVTAHLLSHAALL